MSKKKKEEQIKVTFYFPKSLVTKLRKLKKKQSKLVVESVIKAGLLG